MNEDNQLEFLDILAIISFALAVANLKENELQNTKLTQHLFKQDNEYLKKSIEQNEIIIAQNEELLKLLKGGK